MFRQGCLYFTPINILDAEGQTFQSIKDIELGNEKCLISRIMLLLPIDTGDKPWTGHIHRGLASYLCIVTTFQRYAIFLIFFFVWNIFG